jgi:predicted secreted protein
MVNLLEMSRYDTGLRYAMSGGTMKNAFALVLLLGALPACAQLPAAPPPPGTRVTLEARASDEVDNDTMRATLFTEMEDTDPARLAERVNGATAEALDIARKFEGVRVQTSGYSSYPVSEKGRIVRWRSRSTILLESGDFKVMADAIGKLQTTMQLGSLDFSVSPAARTKAEDALTQAAIGEFLRKAEAIARGFKGTRFEVLEANVSGDGGFVPPPRPMAMKAMSDSAISTPDLEAGTSRITVTVNGAILLPR